MALLNAVKERKLEKVRQLINPHQKVDYRAEARFTDDYGIGAIHVSVLINNFEAFRVLLNSDKTLVTMTTEDDLEQTCAHLAALKNRSDMIRHLVENANFFRLGVSQRDFDNQVRTGASSSGVIDGATNQSSSSLSLPLNVLTFPDKQGNTMLHYMV